MKIVLTGEGISKLFGGFPSDLQIGEEYDATFNYEIKEYIIEGDTGMKYKLLSFEYKKI